jgi:hypothetical protein
MRVSQSFSRAEIGWLLNITREAIGASADDEPMLDALEKKLENMAKRSDGDAPPSMKFRKKT